MTKQQRPIPPPLDEGEQAAAGGPTSDLPLAESGKATAEDAARARAKSSPTAAPAPAAASRRDPRAEAEPTRALISNSSGQVVARPDPATPPDETTEVVHCNWYGHVDGRPVYVRHGTPIDGLPSAVQDAIRATPAQHVGPLPPKQPPNPFAP